MQLGVQPLALRQLGNCGFTRQCTRLERVVPQGPNGKVMEDVQFAVSLEWTILSWGDNMKALSKFSGQEVIGRSVLDIFDQDDLEGLKETLRQASLSMLSDYIRMPFYTKEGEKVDTLIHACLQQTAKGEEILIAGGCIPSTWPCAICSTCITVGVDSEGLVTSWDDMAAATTGIDSRCILSRNFLTYFMTQNFAARDYVAKKKLQALEGKLVNPFMVPVFTIQGELKVVNLCLILNCLHEEPRAEFEPELKGACDKFEGHASSGTLPTMCPPSEADLPGVTGILTSSL
eukprot:TRINITY_DN83148_c0_g1_i1.p1 TRINITY_DN83148_c0_g1~~TRINITY_DN83148_c0_g1_i1.p1  ORF type:complete len:289 (-),score=49.53 TRINITY_DN83148_c0_g1_i1:75-941(-)